MDFGPESETLALVEDTFEYEYGILSLAAMLNKQGKGRLIVGASKDGKLKGMDTDSDVAGMYLFFIEHTISPIPKSRISLETDEESGLSYLVVDVTGTDVPYQAFDLYPIREKAENFEIDCDLLSELHLYDTTSPLRKVPSPRTDLTFNDFFQTAKDRIIPRSLSTVVDLDDYAVEGLDNLYYVYGLKTEKDTFNRFAYIMSDQSDACVLVKKYSGTDTKEETNLKVYGNSSIIKIYDEIVSYATDVATKNLFDIDAFKAALRECLCNSYFANRGNPEILIFDDRIELFYHGRIMFLRETSDFYKENASLSDDELRSFLTMLDPVAEGDHLERVISVYGEEAVKTTREGVTITLPYDGTPFWVKEERQAPVYLNRTERRIKRFLELYPSATVEEVADKLCISLSTAKWNIAKLKKYGIVKREGSNKNGNWVVSDDN